MLANIIQLLHTTQSMYVFHIWVLLWKFDVYVSVEQPVLVLIPMLCVVTFQDQDARIILTVMYADKAKEVLCTVSI